MRLSLFFCLMLSCFHASAQDLVWKVKTRKLQKGEVTQICYLKISNTSNLPVLVDTSPYILDSIKKSKPAKLSVLKDFFSDTLSVSLVQVIQRKYIHNVAPHFPMMLFPGTSFEIELRITIGETDLSRCFFFLRYTHLTNIEACEVVESYERDTYYRMKINFQKHAFPISTRSLRTSLNTLSK
jgi:hypothetical protein